MGLSTGLALPRFVSLKSTKINVRRGPSQDHEVMWVFERKGLPVEVIAEFDHWRQVRDQEGDTGWIFHSLLDGKRTAMIEGEANGDDFKPLYETPNAQADVVALTEPGVIGALLACEKAWCRLSVSGHTGWIARSDLWGVYDGEQF